MHILFITSTCVAILMALTLLFFKFTRKTYPGFSHWTAGSIGMAFGFIFLLLRGVIWDYLSIVMVNIFFPLSVVLHLEGMRKFLKHPPMPRWWYILPGISFLASTVFFFYHDNAAWRNFFMSITVAIPNWFMAKLIFSHTRNDRSSFYPVIGSVMLASGLLIMVRAIWVLQMPSFTIMEESPVQIGYFIAVMVLQIAGNISFIMLTSERLERELSDAETALKQTVEDLQKALIEVKTLGGLLPICANCKKIRDDIGDWHQLESYICKHSEAEFSHGICPECARKLYPELF